MYVIFRTVLYFPKCTLFSQIMFIPMWYHDYHNKHLASTTQDTWKINANTCGFQIVSKSGVPQLRIEMVNCTLQIKKNAYRTGNSYDHVQYHFFPFRCSQYFGGEDYTGQLFLFSSYVGGYNIHIHNTGLGCRRRQGAIVQSCWLPL